MLPLWEFTFQTNDKRLKDALSSFRDLRYGRSRRWILMGIAWLILIAVIFLVIWASASIVVMLEYLVQDIISAEAVSVLAPMAMGALYLLIVRSIGGYFRKKKRDNEIGNVVDSVRIFDTRVVEFSDKDSTKERKIERVSFSRDYLFLTIDGGRRFVFVPREVVAVDTLQKISNWAAEARL